MKNSDFINFNNTNQYNIINKTLKLFMDMLVKIFILGNICLLIYKLSILIINFMLPLLRILIWVFLINMSVIKDGIVVPREYNYNSKKFLIKHLQISNNINLINN